MGIWLQDIKGNGPIAMESAEYILEEGFVWLVGRRDSNVPPGEKANYHIQGTASNEQMAIEMCLDETYFIGPLPINTALPHEVVEWVGLYFPLGQQEDE